MGSRADGHTCAGPGIRHPGRVAAGRVCRAGAAAAGRVPRQAAADARLRLGGDPADDAQLASAPEGSVKLSLSLRGVGKLISAPRPKVTAAERQIQVAHPPVQMRAHEPPSQSTEMRAGGCEIDFVVNLELLA